MKSKLKLVLITFLLIATVFSILVLFESSNKKLTVSFLDIGQGDSILIDVPSGKQVLIDGGSGRQVLRELGRSMSFFDKEIDIVIATHPDADHVGGLLSVLDRYNVDVFMEPGVTSDTEVYKSLKEKVLILETEGKIKRIEARRGMILDLGGGAVLQILFPVRDPYFLETNTASIVARLVYGENEFLFTGDSPKEIERYLVVEDEKGVVDIGADVLKAGHHGSHTSTSREYVQAVSPQYAVISAGKDNRYGHPHQEVLDILNNFGAKILRTDTQGRIVFESDGVNLKVK